MSKVFTLKNEPRGPVYRALLDLGQAKCHAALLVVRPDLGLNETGVAVRKRLEPYLIEQRWGPEWPGTLLLYGGAATILRYMLEPGCAEILKEVSNSLFGWLQPGLPEDLCLLRSDGAPWLVTIAHEKEAYLEVDEGELQDLIDSIPDLKDMN